jgi:large conductance mechanosensitive channel
MATAVRSVAGGPKDVGLSNEFLTLGRAWNERHQPPSTPIVAAIVGKPDFSDLAFTIDKSEFRYGDFINAALQFVLIAAAVYFFVVVPIKALSEMQARLRAVGESDDEVASIFSDEAILLREIRDLLSARSSV